MPDKETSRTEFGELDGFKLNQLGGIPKESSFITETADELRGREKVAYDPNLAQEVEDAVTAPLVEEYTQKQPETDLRSGGEVDRDVLNLSLDHLLPERVKGWRDRVYREQLIRDRATAEFQAQTQPESIHDYSDDEPTEAEAQAYDELATSEPDSSEFSWDDLVQETSESDGPVWSVESENQFLDGQ